MSRGGRVVKGGDFEGMIWAWFVGKRWGIGRL